MIIKKPFIFEKNPRKSSKQSQKRSDYDGGAINFVAVIAFVVLSFGPLGDKPLGVRYKLPWLSRSKLP